MGKHTNLDVLLTRMSPDARKAFVDKTMQFLQDEYEVEIGEFDVEEILGFFCEAIAPIFYDQGVEDARTMLEKRFGEITEDLAMLQIAAPER